MLTDLGRDEIDQADDRHLAEIFADVPSTRLPRQRLAGAGLAIVDALVEGGLARTKSEARRTVQQGGAYVNNRRVDSIEMEITSQHLAGRSIVVLRAGKKRYALLRVS